MLYVKDYMVNILGFVDGPYCCNIFCKQSTLSLQYEGSHRKYVMNNYGCVLINIYESRQWSWGSEGWSVPCMKRLRLPINGHGIQLRLFGYCLLVHCSEVYVALRGLACLFYLLFFSVFLTEKQNIKFYFLIL